MIDTEPTAVGANPPAVEGSPPPRFYPVTPAGGAGPGPLSRRERRWVAIRVWWRLLWTRLRFRFWWVHRLRLGLVQARLKLRLLLLRRGRPDRRR